VTVIEGGDDFISNGVMGLAPVPGKWNYVERLFEERRILFMYVGLNYEYPDDIGQVSRITFGYFDYTQIKYGRDGLFWYENVGIDFWAFFMK